MIWRIVGGLANVGVVLLIAPLCEGLLRKVTACLQSRRGPPLWQPYIDLLKLLGKEDIESGESPRLQRFVARLSLAAVLTVACLVPMGFPAPMNGAGDVILLIYLLTLCGICTLLGGLAAGSTYSLLGIGREMMTMIALEPLFAIALLVGAVHVRSFRLDAVLNGSVYAAEGIPWSGLILLVVMVLSFQAFVQRVPFDMSAAETEIMEGPLMEYSGPKLALFKVRANGAAGRSQRVVRRAVCALGIGTGLPAGLAAVLGQGAGARAGGDGRRRHSCALPH